jgi:hypothetical protein
MLVFKFCALCDEVRLEKDTNKAFIIGFFGMLPHVDIAVSHPSQPIPRLTFFFMSGAPVKAGNYHVRLSVKGPGQQELPFEMPSLAVEATAAPLNVTFTLQPLQLNGTGLYRITAIVNGQEDFAADLVVSEAPLPN